MSAQRGRETGGPMPGDERRKVRFLVSGATNLAVSGLLFAAFLAACTAVSKLA